MSTSVHSETTAPPPPLSGPPFGVEDEEEEEEVEPSVLNPKSIYQVEQKSEAGMIAYANKHYIPTDSVRKGKGQNPKRFEDSISNSGVLGIERKNKSIRKKGLNYVFSPLNT